MTVKKETAKNDVIKQYVRNLPEEDWKFIYNRLTQRLGGDLGEAVELMEKNAEVDKFLSQASSAMDYYARIDHIDACVQNDLKRRSAVIPANAPARR